MDLKNFETTTTYAIEAVYNEYWRLIPERFRLPEKPQKLNEPEKKKKKESPLQIKDIDEKEQYEKRREENEEERGEFFYTHYCDLMNSGKRFDLQPFYDPQLDFENRLHYKITDIPFPIREKPWFVITWNMGNGALKSSLTRRRFESGRVVTPGGEEVKFDFINTDLDLTFAIYSNSLQALMELQENIIIGKREKCTVDTNSHFILGSFPVSLDIIDSSVNKLPRDKGTLCTLTLNVKIDYPIIGNIRDARTGIIKEIHLELDAQNNREPEITDEFTFSLGPQDPTEHEVLSRDIITEDTPDLRPEPYRGEQVTFKF